MARTSRAKEKRPFSGGDTAATEGGGNSSTESESGRVESKNARLEGRRPMKWTCHVYLPFQNNQSEWRRRRVYRLLARHALTPTYLPAVQHSPLRSRLGTEMRQERQTVEARERGREVVRARGLPHFFGYSAPSARLSVLGVPPLLLFHEGRCAGARKDPLPLTVIRPAIHRSLAAAGEGIKRRCSSLDTSILS